MKALFLVDNILAIDMLAPIIGKLPRNWTSALVDYGATNRIRANVSSYAQKIQVKCGVLVKHDKRTVRAMLEWEQPDIVVLSREETNIVEKSVTELGKERNIPTLLVPHGMLTPHEAKLYGAEGRLYRLKHLYALLKQGYRLLTKGDVSIGYLLRSGIFRIRNDFREKGVLSRYDNFSVVAVYGEAMKKILLGYNVKPECIVVTGNPKFDGYRESTTDDRSLHKNTILLLTAHFVEFGLWTAKQRKDFVLDVSWVANELSQKLNIKIHPTMESVDDYAGIVERLGSTVPIYQHESLARLIGDCDIGITLMSSAGLEVMATGKPLVIYNPYDNPTPYPLGSGVFTANDIWELLTTIGGIIHSGMSDKQKELADAFVYAQVYKLDGKAAKRIAGLIVRMVSKELERGTI